MRRPVELGSNQHASTQHAHQKRSWPTETAEVRKSPMLKIIRDAPTAARGCNRDGPVRAVETELRPGGEVGYLRIATEEAFAPTELLAEWRRALDDGVDDPGFRSLFGFILTSDTPRAQFVRERLPDLGERRLADMDAMGIDRQILSIGAPGPNPLERDRATAMATLANDQLAVACQQHPDRFSALATIAPQDAGHAAAELERCKNLGFVGTIVNSHVDHEYLDDAKFWPILEAAEALDLPLYLHPNTPSKGLIGPMLDLRLEGAMFGFAVETALHLLRLIVSGVFDRFPKLRVVVGHLGEGLPFWLYRLDYMFRSGGRRTENRAARLPSEYLRENVWVTTSGMPWSPSIMLCREVLGPDRVLYAMDYPWQVEADEVRAHDALLLSLEDKQALMQTNAERLFGLPTAKP
jgi:2,3-dihydroxybenzoate decarboxylase